MHVPLSAVPITTCLVKLHSLSNISSFTQIRLAPVSLPPLAPATHLRLVAANEVTICVLITSLPDTPNGESCSATYNSLFERSRSDSASIQLLPLPHVTTASPVCQESVCTTASNHELPESFGCRACCLFLHFDVGPKYHAEQPTRGGGLHRWCHTLHRRPCDGFAH